MKVLVAGGTGFLGGYVTDAFAKAGHATRRVGYRDGVDLTREADASQLLAREVPDLVVNCAALQGGLAFVKRYPARIFRDNVLMNMNLLSAAEGAGVRRVINVLANCSYPGEARGLMREDSWWNGPLHESVLAYGMTKKVAWTYAWCLSAEGRLAVTHLLLVNLYGPGEHTDPERSHALGALIGKILNARATGARRVEVWGTGRPIRDWLYVEDAARAILAAAAIDDPLGLYNVGSGEGISIADLAQCIKEELGWDGEFYYNVEKPDGAPYKVLDTAKFRQATGWSPRVSLREGIRKTLAFYAEAARVPSHGLPDRKA